MHRYPFADDKCLPPPSLLSTIIFSVPTLTEGSAAGGTKGTMRLLFSGVQPRVAWIGIGGFVFFGAYEQSKRVLWPLWE